MAIIHLLLQGKGGVGKSFVASILYQYLKSREESVYGFDTDPVNSTFAGYKEFDIKLLDIMRGDDIDPRRFDEMIETICLIDEDEDKTAQVVIDNGASCFISLCGYLKENEALKLLKDQGHQVIMHSVITGGQAIGDTLSGLKSLTTQFKETPIVVWLNPYYGDIALDGSDFYQFKVYTEASSSFKAVIELPTLRPNTFGKDLEALLAKRMSFKAAIKSSLPLMTRSRLCSIWNSISQAIDRAHLV